MKYKPGDLLFVKPNGWLFKAVRWWTKGKYGHIGMVAGFCQEHPIIVEADRRGVDINDLKWRTVREENYAIYRINDLTDKQCFELVAECLSDVGLPYDFSAWTNFIIGSTAFGKSKQRYCSELIYRALRKSKIIKKDVHNPEKVAPADIYNLLEDRMTLIARVEWN